MKRFIIFLSVVMTLASSDVFAAEYDIPGNYVTDITDNTYKTIKITKDSDGSIVYLGQSEPDTAFSSSVRFLLKAEPEEGAYTMYLGGNSAAGVPEERHLYIGSPVKYEDRDKAYAKVWREESSVAFAWEELDDISQYGSLIVEIGDKVYGVGLDDVRNISGAVSLGLKLTDVDALENVEAYLSSKSVTGNALSQ